MGTECFGTGDILPHSDMIYLMAASARNLRGTEETMERNATTSTSRAMISLTIESRATPQHVITTRGLVNDCSSRKAHLAMHGIEGVARLVHSAPTILCAVVLEMTHARCPLPVALARIRGSSEVRSSGKEH